VYNTFRYEQDVQASVSMHGKVGRRWTACAALMATSQ
jgi:hypothetical protein